MLTLGRKALSVPILQGGMGVGVSLGGLAGAVAACGGMGCISTADAGYREPDFARDPASANHRALTAEIRKAKEIAKGAGMVAINAMVATQDYAAAIRTAVEAGVDAVVSGAGLPLELPGIVGTTDVAIAPIVSSGRAAKLILRRWAKEFADKLRHPRVINNTHSFMIFSIFRHLRPPGCQFVRFFFIDL